MWIFKLLFWVVILLTLAYLAFLIYAGWNISVGVGIIMTLFSVSVAFVILIIVAAISNKGTNDRRD